MNRRLHQSELPPSLVTRILLAYGLPDPETFEIVHLPRGFGLPGTRIRRGEDCYVIKPFHAHHPAARQHFALRIQAHFHASGVLCPDLLRTPAGDLQVAVDGHEYFVRHWCPGDKFAVDPAPPEVRTIHRRCLGHLVGTLHAAASPDLAAAAPPSSRRTPHDQVRRLARVQDALPWRRGGKLAQSLWWRLCERGEFGRDLRAAIPRLDAMIGELQASGLADDPRVQDLITVHGDYNYENIVFAGDRPSAIVDFENALVSSRALDVGDALSVFCQEGEDEQAFLEGYEAGSGLRRPDDDLLRYGVRLRLARSLTYQIIDYTHRRSQLPDQSRWWMQQLLRSLAHEDRASRA